MRTLISNLTQKFSKTTIVTAAVTAFAVVAVPASVFAWGPNRPTFTIQQPASYVTFNSITNNPSHGDERNFMQVRDKDARNETYTDEIALTGGKEYVVYVYYHNNAASNLNASGKGIAQGAYTRAEVPAVVKNGATTKAAAYVGASNAQPTNVYDDIAFKNMTGGDISLRYVPGSTTIHNFGSTNGATLPDTILGGSGVKLGYNALDGTLPGCNEYAGYVTFRVKADQPNFTFKKDVRLSGTSQWQDSITAKPGDKVDYQLSYQNTGSILQSGVTIKDTLPAGVTYIPGTTSLVNKSNPNGLNIGDNLAKNGINIGNYNPSSTAAITYSATVDGKDCTTLTNRATVATPNGGREDTASVTVGKENCTVPTTPESLPTTGPAEVIAGFIGLAAVTVGVVYYYKSRRELQDILTDTQLHPSTTGTVTETHHDVEHTTAHKK